MSPRLLPIATKVRQATPSLSLRSLPKAVVLAALPFSLLCGGRAEAITTISQTISNTTLSAFNNLSFARTPNPRSTSSSLFQDFNAFDASLGTLVGVRFEGNGDLLGSFRGAKSSSSTTGGAASLSSGTATLTLSFNGTGWITNNTGGATSFIGASPLATTTSANIGSTGTLLTSTDPTLTLTGSTTDPNFLSYFEGGPGDVVQGTFTWGLQLTSANLSGSGSCATTASVKCTGFNFSPTGLGTGQTALRGDINDFTLYYDYVPFPSNAVPAPLPLLGSGVAFAYTRRLRRRIQKARITL